MTAGQAAVPFSPSGDSRRVASIVLDPTYHRRHRLRRRFGRSGPAGRGRAARRRGQNRRCPGRSERHRVRSDRSRARPPASARWDFTPAETAALFRRTGNAAAIHLAMGWPAHPPKHRKLQLFVRYVTADGRKLEANQPIEIALPGDRTASWTPVVAATRGERPAESRAGGVATPGRAADRTRGRRRAVHRVAQLGADLGSPCLVARTAIEDVLQTEHGRPACPGECGRDARAPEVARPSFWDENCHWGGGRFPATIAARRRTSGTVV